jgi:hypothetical protein
MPFRLLTMLCLLCLLPAMSCSGTADDDDDSSVGDDDDSVGDDDDSVGDDDDSVGDDDDSVGDDDDSAGDDDDSSVGDDDDSSVGDDDDSATGTAWQQCASVGNAPDADGWTALITAPGGLFGDGNSTLNGGGSSGITDPSWGLWSQTGGAATVTRAFAGGELGTDDSVRIEFDNGWLETDGEVGISWHASGSELLRFSFRGGDTEYKVTDGSGTNFATGVAYSTDGMDVTLFQRASGTYELLVDGVSVRSGQYASNNLLAEEIRVFSLAAGPGPQNHDLYFNCLTITRQTHP